tara:strand:- start:7428 stop:8759 length:1332 start_codon:yes stop_codon:yes gene_type:complete
MGLLSDNTHKEYYQGNDYGNYQFTSLRAVIEQFMVAYVGENKIIPKISKLDVAFHAQRALQELSFDTLKSFKGLEQVIPASLQMTLPKDYVNYTKISWVDSSGVKHIIYPTSKTSNPVKYKVDSNNDYVFNQSGGLISPANLIANGDFDDNTGWTLSGGAGTQWTIGDVSVTQPNTAIYTYNNVAQGGQNSDWGYMEIAAPEIIEGRRYRITYDIVVASTGGQFILANHTTVASTLNSDPNDNNVDLINETIVGTHSVEWIQGSSNTGKISLYNDSAFDGIIDNIKVVRVGHEEESSTWSSYKSNTPLENQDDYQDDTYWPMNGSRYGLDPQHAQANGSFYIDNLTGKIHFSSNISGKTVILDYISDSLGTDGEMQVHKFAEEAMYKCIAHAVISTSSYGQQLVPRLTKEKFAAVRKAKLRLSNVKLEELTQILRGKSKQLKH